MHDTKKKNVLFWCLVSSIFFIVFLLWLPQFIASIQTLAKSVGSTSRGTTKTMRDDIAPQIEEMKKSFDTLLKQIPTQAPNTENRQMPAAN